MYGPKLLAYLLHFLFASRNRMPPATVAAIPPTAAPVPTITTNDPPDDDSTMIATKTLKHRAS